MKREEVEELLRLAEAATKGPWEEHNYHIARLSEHSYDLVCYTATNNSRRTPQARQDGEFIAAARNNVPELCRALLDAMDENDKLTKANTRLVFERDEYKRAAEIAIGAGERAIALGTKLAVKEAMRGDA